MQNNPNAMETFGLPRLGSIGDVAATLGVSRQGAYRLYREGEFNEFLVRVGQKHLRFRLDGPHGLDGYIRRGGKRLSQIAEDNDEL